MFTCDVETIRKSPTVAADNRGEFAQFRYINGTWGLKYWYSSHSRDEEYRKNSHAAEHNLGPATGAKIDFELDDQQYYGFFVELVKIYGESEDYNEAEYGEGSHDEAMDACHILENELRDIGFTSVCDMHCNNFGQLPDGTWVVTDFNLCGLPLDS